MIKIICVGKIKENYIKEAIEEYLKRLSKYTKIDIIEVEDDSSDDEVVSLNNEKERILKNIKKTDYVIILDINGEELDSIMLSRKLDNLLTTGHSNIAFIIGGSYGLHKEVKEKANFNLSFSRLTFPHQLFRVVVLEQIYRSFKIMNNETYHK